MKKKVLIGIVVFNEERGVAKVLRRIEVLLRKTTYHVIFVDDGSTDGSSKLLQCFIENNNRAKLFKNAKNSGVGKSIKKIIVYGIQEKFDICTIMAGNGKDDPLQIPLLIEPVLKNECDYVQGSRFLAGGSYKNLPFARKFMIKGFTSLVWIFTGFYGTDASNGFRAYTFALFEDKRINIRQKWLDRYEFETYLHYKIISLGYKIKEVPVSKDYLVGVKKYSKIRPFVDWWKMMRPLFLLRFGIKK